MNGIFGMIVFAVINHAIGAYIWHDAESQKMMQSCIEANPKIASGDIKKYCEERLYLKASE